MPTSFLDVIPITVQAIIDLQPQSVLDIGPGYGKYGHLTREYVDHYPWHMQIDAVEAFPEYLYRMGNRGIYNFLYEDDFKEAIVNCHYDLALMIDVIEHFEKPAGLGVLAKAMYVADRVLISTPANPGVQGAEYGNSYERHLSKWTTEDFQDFNWREIYNGHAIIGVIGE